MENMQLALSLLLAGFLIVFTVLVTLIIIILIYGKIIQKAQKTVAVRREKKAIIRVEELQSQSPASDVPAGGKVFGDDPEQMKQAGIIYAAEQIIDLISNGVGHIHVYSMNKPEVAAGILNNLSSVLR